MNEDLMPFKFKYITNKGEEEGRHHVIVIGHCNYDYNEVWNAFSSICFEHEFNLSDQKYDKNDTYRYKLNINATKKLLSLEVLKEYDSDIYERTPFMVDELGQYIVSFAYQQLYALGFEIAKLNLPDLIYRIDWSYNDNLCSFPFRISDGYGVVNH